MLETQKHSLLRVRNLLDSLVYCQEPIFLKALLVLLSYYQESVESILNQIQKGR